MSHMRPSNGKNLKLVNYLSDSFWKILSGQFIFSASK